MMELKR